MRTLISVIWTICSGFLIVDLWLHIISKDSINVTSGVFFTLVTIFWGWHCLAVIRKWLKKKAEEL